MPHTKCTRIPCYVGAAADRGIPSPRPKEIPVQSLGKINVKNHIYTHTHTSETSSEHSKRLGSRHAQCLCIYLAHVVLDMNRSPRHQHQVLQDTAQTSDSSPASPIAGDFFQPIHLPSNQHVSFL